MTHIYVFNGLLVLTFLYAMWGGGAPERATAVVFIVAAAATFVVPYHRFNQLEIMVLAVDLITLGALTAIALRANRFWPLYESALQLLGVAIHGVKAYQPDFVYWMYNGASGKLAYPTLMLLAIGVFRHRQRIAAFGSDRDWSPLRNVSAPAG